MPAFALTFMTSSGTVITERVFHLGDDEVGAGVRQVDLIQSRHDELEVAASIAKKALATVCACTPLKSIDQECTAPSHAAKDCETLRN